VVLQDDSLAISQTLRDPPSLLAIQHDPAEILVHGVVFVEAQAVLGDHVELAAEDREGFAVDAVVGWVVSRRDPSRSSCGAVSGWLSMDSPMSVASGVHIRPRLVDFRVDGESRCVDGLFADDDFSVFVDENEVAHSDLGEMS
jgi:hypothetical protein